jgi:hypothetical protein
MTKGISAGQQKCSRLENNQYTRDGQIRAMPEFTEIQKNN